MDKDLIGTTIEVKFSFDGIDYVGKAKLEKVDDVKYNYSKSAKVIRSAIKKVDVPRTPAKITEEVRKHVVMSQKFVIKILDMFDGDMWEHSMHEHSHGGRPSKDYRLLKKKKDK